MKSRRFWLKVQIVLASVFAGVVALAHPVQALSDYYLDMFAANGIYYYNPEGVDANCSTRTTGSNVTIIGDSITEGSKDEIRGLISSTTIYSAVSKQFGSADDEAVSPSDGSNPSGISILKYLVANGSLRSILVFALGTNNTALAEDAVNEVLSLSGSNTQVYFVTNYRSDNPTAYDHNNSLLRTAAQNANVNVIDWAGAAAADSGKYISSDGVHPTAEGKKLFAELITTAVGGGLALQEVRMAITQTTPVMLS